MLIIIVIFSLHFILSQIAENLPTKSVMYTLNFLLFALVIYMTWGITYTGDWYMYYYFFKNESDETDLMYYWLSVLFNKLHLSMEDLFRFHIIVTTILYYILISKFSRNIFYVFLAFMVMNFVHSVNQIRYFMGFPILCLGFYYFLLKRRYFLSIPFFVVAILCHSALSVLLVFLPLYIIPRKRFVLFSLLGAVLAYLIINYIFTTQLGAEIEHFGAYFDKDNASSFIGGLFNSLPYLAYIGFLLVETPLVKSNYPKNKFADDKVYTFLYKISFFTIIFIPSSFFIQIIGHRYVIPFYIFWVLYYMYIIKDLPKNKRIFRYFIFGLVHIFVAAVFYVLPDYILHENHFIEELNYILKSVRYLKDLIYY